MKKNSREEAFEAALQKYESALYKICLIYTDRTPENVDDLYQEIVYNLWRSYPSFKGESKLTTWVYGVALNVARRHRDNQMRMPQFVGLSPAICEELAEERSDGQLQRLYELIDRLPRDDRKVVTLYLEGESVKNMAKALHCTERTVDRRIHDIKDKLKKLNEED